MHFAHVHYARSSYYQVSVFASNSQSFMLLEARSQRYSRFLTASQNQSGVQAMNHRLTLSAALNAVSVYGTEEDGENSTQQENGGQVLRH